MSFKVLFLRKYLPEQPEFYKETERNQVMPLDGKQGTPSVEKLEKKSKPGSENEILQSICNKVNAIEEILKGKELDIFLTAEWKCLGKVIERFTFWVCVIVSGIGFITIYV